MNDSVNFDSEGFIGAKFKTPVYSCVLPVYNEEESLRTLLSELLQYMAESQKPYEIIFVNDGSDDGSKTILENFHKELPEIVRVVHLDSKKGQTYALKTGIEKTRGSVVITLDSDLQNDPADILKLIEELYKGFDCVCGWRKSRQDSLLKTVLSKMGNLMQPLFTGLKVHDVSCTLRAYQKHCANNIPLNWEGQHRFIPLSLSLQKYKISEIQTNHRKRQFGKSKYSHGRIFRVIVDFFKILKARGKR